MRARDEAERWLGSGLGTSRAGNARACCVHSEDSPRAVRPNRVTMPPCNASRVVQDDQPPSAPSGWARARTLDARLRCRCGSARRHKGQPHHYEDNPRVPTALGRSWPTAQLAPDDGPPVGLQKSDESPAENAITSPGSYRKRNHVPAEPPCPAENAIHESLPFD